VRKHLKLAEKQQWIKVYLKRRKGQAWFNHEYGAIIPDALAQFCTSKPWEDDPTWRRAANSAGRSVDNPQHPEIGARHPENGAGQAEVDDTTPGKSCHDARHQLPTNSSSESLSNPSLNTPHKVLPSAGRVVLDIPKKLDPEEEQRAIKAAEQKAAERQRKDAEERINRIRAMTKAFPDYTNADIAKVARVTIAEVEQLRAAL
jgi:hypothetical protein